MVEVNSWDFCQDLFDKKIKLICEEVGATEPPLLFITSTPYINKLLNKGRKRREEEEKVFKPLFRYEVAKTKDYKGTRKSDKPYHFKNIINYILASYDVYVTEDGLEADDAMCIHQYSRLIENDTIICSRDKDLKQCQGNHFTWEAGKQPSWGPFYVDKLGKLEKIELPKKKPEHPTRYKYQGTGDLFFYFQMLTGDVVDNIVGVMGKGPAFAYNLLHDAESSRKAYELTAEKYVQAWGDEWEEKWKEMADLLYMIREKDEEGNPVPWKVPAYD